MALGADAQFIVKRTVLQAFELVASGLVLGVLGALALTRYLSSLLYLVTNRDAMTFAAGAMTLLIVACLAAYLPAEKGRRHLAAARLTARVVAGNRSQIQRLRCPAEGSQEAGNLAAMVGRVIDDVQDQLPHRLLPGIPAHVTIGQVLLNRGIGRSRGPLLPTLLKGGRLGPKFGQRHFGRGQFRLRLLREPGEPEEVRPVDVDQGSQRAPIGGLKVAGQFFRREFGE